MDRPIDDFTQTDALLDTALRSYAETGENDGLETRVLARTAESCDKKRLTLLPRVWTTRVGLAAAAALLIAVALSPALHRRAAPREPAAMHAAIHTLKPVPMRTLPSVLEPRFVRTATQLRRSRAAKLKHPTQIVSRPFSVLPPSEQEKGLLALNAKQRDKLLSSNSPDKPHYFDPVPLEVSAIQIAPLDIKTIEDK